MGARFWNEYGKKVHIYGKQVHIYGKKVYLFRDLKISPKRPIGGGDLLAPMPGVAEPEFSNEKLCKMAAEADTRFRTSPMSRGLPDPEARTEARNGDLGITEMAAEPEPNNHMERAAGNIGTRDLYR